MSKRLTNITNAIPACNVLCDVGCDHGYVGISALAKNKCNKVVFVDVSQPSLDKARANCPEELCDNVSFVCQDGIADVECDCAVIAGMGGLEIISVLGNARKLPQSLVLQPMRNVYDVRSYVSRYYNVNYDEMFFDGKYYDLIVCSRAEGGCTLDELQLNFGRTNVAKPSKDFVDYVQKELNKYNTIAKQCNDAVVSNKLQLLNKIARLCKEEQQ